MESIHPARDSLLQLLDQVFDTAIGPELYLQTDSLECRQLGPGIGGLDVVLNQCQALIV